MHYEEKVIDGVLHWRGTPNGKWQKCTDGQITAKYEELKDALHRERQRSDSLEAVVKDVLENAKEAFDEPDFAAHTVDHIVESGLLEEK